MVNGIPEVQAMFRRKAAAVARAVREASRKGGDDVASAMRYLAPTSDEGKLVRSIRVEDTASRMTSKGVRADFIGVIVKAGDETTIVTNTRGQQFQNAKLQENGTKNMPANPFFNPAWRMNRSKVRGAISRAARKAWAK